MDEIPIKPEDAERIDGMVRQYRSQIENLYRIAYLQGAIDAETEAVRKMRAPAENVTA